MSSCSTAAVGKPGGRRYDGLYERIVANTVPEHESEQACWCWTGKKRCRYGYARMNLWVPGLQRSVGLTVHVVMWIVTHTKARKPDEVYLAYLELRYSRLQIDHTCVNAPCANPDHLDGPVTAQVNAQRRDSRKAKQEWRQ